MNLNEKYVELFDERCAYIIGRYGNQLIKRSVYWNITATPQVDIYFKKVGPTI